MIMVSRVPDPFLPSPAFLLLVSCSPANSLPLPTPSIRRSRSRYCYSLKSDLCEHRIETSACVLYLCGSITAIRVRGRTLPPASGRGNKTDVDTARPLLLRGKETLTRSHACRAWTLYTTHFLHQLTRQHLDGQPSRRTPLYTDPLQHTWARKPSCPKPMELGIHHKIRVRLRQPSFFLVLAFHPLIFFTHCALMHLASHPHRMKETTLSATVHHPTFFRYGPTRHA